MYCTGKRASEAKGTWAAVWALLIALAVVAVGAYAIYKYRLRVSNKIHLIVLSFHGMFLLASIFFWNPMLL